MPSTAAGHHAYPALVTPCSGDQTGAISACQSTCNYHAPARAGSAGDLAGARPEVVMKDSSAPSGTAAAPVPSLCRCAGWVPTRYARWCRPLRRQSPDRPHYGGWSQWIPHARQNRRCWTSHPAARVLVFLSGLASPPGGHSRAGVRLTFIASGLRSQLQRRATSLDYPRPCSTATPQPRPLTQHLRTQAWVASRARPVAPRYPRARTPDGSIAISQRGLAAFQIPGWAFGTGG